MTGVKPARDNDGGRPQNDNRTFLEKALRNTTTSGLGTVSTVAVQFIFAGLSIRYLGTGRAGFFLALQTLVGLNTLVGDFGLGMAATRQVAVLAGQGRYEEARRTIASVSLINGGTALILAMALFVSFEPLFRWSRLDFNYYSDARLATALTLVGFVITQLTVSWRATYGALQRYEIDGGMNTISGLAVGIGGIGALTLLPTMTSLALTRTVVAVIRSAVDGFIVSRLIGATPWPRLFWQSVKPLTRFGLWNYAETLGGTLLGRANTIILTQFLGSSSLPYYELPQRAFTQIHAALAGQLQFLVPLLSAYGDQTIARLRRTEDRLRWMVAVAGVHIFVPVALIGPTVFSHLISPEFAVKSAPLLYLACIQGILNAVDIVPYYASLAIGSAKPNAVANLLQGFLVAGSAYLLIPRYGVIGAGLSQLWVVGVVIGHIVWVGRLVPRTRGEAHRGAAYVSPACMLGAWLVAAWLSSSWTTGIMSTICGVLVGGAAGWAVLIVIERTMFSTRGRLKTLQRILGEAWHRIARRGLAKRHSA